MYCPKCGSAISDPEQSCQSCGHQLHAATPTSEPVYQEGYQQPAKTSGLAIAALVLGLVTLIPCLGYLTFIPAIVISIIALVKISKSQGQLKGNVMAIIGMVVAVLSILVVSVVLMGFATMIPTFDGELAKRVQCQSNLSALGRAVIMYNNDYKGEMPPTLETLIDTEGMSPLSLLCPSSGDVSGDNSYIYRGNDLPANASGDLIVVYDKYENHDGECRNVLYNNSLVRRLDELAFQRAIERDNQIRQDLGLPVKPLEEQTVIYEE